MDENRISAAEADAISQSLRTDEARYDVRYFGMLVAASFLPGPPGTRSITRFALVLYFRFRSARQFGRGQISEEEHRRAQRLHTVPVAVFALIPGLGAAAYLLAPSMRKSAPVIGALAIDGVAHKAPFRLYYRLRIDRLTAYVVKRARAERGAERRHFPVTPYHALQHVRRQTH